jgi:3-oxoacyl-[acyl-carrier protein] reductase
VTGGSRGIGRAIAERLAGDGFEVLLTWNRRNADADEVVRRIADGGGQARALRLDLADTGSIDALLDEIGPPVDVLVNNAGEIRDRLFALQTEDDLRHVVEVNLLGTLRLTRGVLRGMLRKRSGRIVNLSSDSALIGNRGQTNYSAAKGAMISFSKSLAREVGEYGISVNVVAPGFVETEILSGLPDAKRSGATAAIPLGRFGRPEEIAGVVSFLSSPDSSYFTGTVIRVDGGLAA